MAPFLLSIFSLLLLLSRAAGDGYFSKSTLSTDYHNMLTTLKIFIYPPPLPPPSPPHNHRPPLSLFHNSLLKSHFLTTNPNHAHLFFLPFSPQSTRSLARLIQHTRSSFPFWNRTLGTDHFYLTRRGVGPSSSRNVVELKKNAVQVSCFPSPAGEFIPHKDITLPPPNSSLLPRALREVSSTRRWLGYWRYNPVQSGSELISDLKNDTEFLIESEPSDPSLYIERVKSSKFCLIVYDGDREVVGLGEALALGCVPVVITDRPIQDLPLMDVIRWSEIALFVGARVDKEQLKRVMIRACESDEYVRMRRLGVAAAHHLVWNETPEPLDAFYMVMYQLWSRRHAIRYASWGGGEEVAQV